MAKPEPETRARTVLEPLTQFDLSTHSQSPTRSLAISTVSDSQTLIYIGTLAGTLILLQSSPKTTSFLQAITVADGSPIDRIIVLPEIAKLLVLSDGSLFLLDSFLSQPAKKLAFFKGVSAITRRFRSAGNQTESLDFIDSTASSSSSSSSSLEYASASQRLLQRLSGGIRSNGLKIKESEQQQQQQQQQSEANNLGHFVFAVVIGKRLILVELVLGNRVNKTDVDVNGAYGSLVVLKEIQCIDGVITLVWLDDSIVVGTVNGYSLFSCVTGQSGIIFTLPDMSTPPRLKLLWKEWNVLLLVDNVGVLVDEHGRPVGGSLVFRRGGPDSIGEMSSYVVVVRDGKMEVYHKKSGRCIQSISFGGEGVGACIVADEEVGSGKLVAVATPNKVCKTSLMGLHPFLQLMVYFVM